MTGTRAISALALAALLLAGGACGGSEEAAPSAVFVSPLGPTEARAAQTEGAAEPDAPPPEPTRTPRFVSLDYLTGEVEVPPLPSAFAPALPDGGLLQAVSAALREEEEDLTPTPTENGAAVSVVVHNLADGRYAAVDEGRVYYAASVFKMAVLMEAYRQRDAGELDFSSHLTLSGEYLEYDLGTLDLLGLYEDDSFTLADALKAMIVVSDTPTAVMVQRLVGAGRMDATLRSLGVSDTSFSDRDLPTTAADMALLLEAVARGDGVTEESRREMLALLLQEGIRDGVSSGVPPETAVAHKSGSYGSFRHDVALVWGPAGPYVIAVMTDQPRGWQPLADVSSAVWAYFAANP